MPDSDVSASVTSVTNDKRTSQDRENGSFKVCLAAVLSFGDRKLIFFGIGKLNMFFFSMM